MRPLLYNYTEPSRQSDWDSIAACHCGLSVVTTWNSYKSSMGAHKLRHERFSNIHLKAIAEVGIYIYMKKERFVHSPPRVVPGMESSIGQGLQKFSK